MRFLYVLCVSALLLCSWACQPPKRGAPVGKLKVVATVSMIYDAVRVIGGDSVTATALMGPGVDPHVYKATQGDLKKLAEADLILYNGLFLEGKMGEILEKQSRIKAVRAVAESVPKDRLLLHPQYENAPDPHIWFDVQLWKQAVEEISLALQAEDTRNEAFYQENTIAYLRQLDSLDAWVRDTLRYIEQPYRVLVTAHDAFGYFGKAYGLEVRGVQGISTQADFGLRDISDLVQFVVERQIPAIFMETSVSDKALRAIIEGAAAQGHRVGIGGKLYSDAMGAFGTEEGTYVGMFRANVRTIVKALAPKEPLTTRGDQSVPKNVIRDSLQKLSLP